MANFLNENDKRITPHASVIVFNYLTRGGNKEDYNTTKTSGVKNTQNPGTDIINQIVDNVEVFKLDSHIINIVTQKNKYNNDSNFIINLAPTINWTGRITLGSWIVIMMSSTTEISQQDYRYANAKLLKYIGQIQSVEENISYDLGRKTIYTIRGTEWGNVLNDGVYFADFIQGTATNNLVQYNTVLANVFQLYDVNLDPKDGPIKTINIHDQIINFIKRAWAYPDGKLMQNLISSSASFYNKETGSNAIANINSGSLSLPVNTSYGKLTADMLLHPFYTYSIPKKLRSFLRLPTTMKNQTVPLINYFIKVKGNPVGAYKIPQLGDLTRTRSVWDFLNSITEPAFFELFTEISWKKLEKDDLKNISKAGSIINTIQQQANPLKSIQNAMLTPNSNDVYIPQLCVYHRAKPFVVNRSFMQETVSNLWGKDSGIMSSADTIASKYIGTFISYFTDLNKTYLSPEDFIDISLNYDWKSKINFVQITNEWAERSHLSGGLKPFSQYFDYNSFIREGFRPLTVVVSLFPIDPKDAAQQIEKSIAEETKQTKTSINKAVATGVVANKGGASFLPAAGTGATAASAAVGSSGAGIIIGQQSAISVPRANLSIKLPGVCGLDIASGLSSASSISFPNGLGSISQNELLNTIKGKKDALSNTLKQYGVSDDDISKIKSIYNNPTSILNGAKNAVTNQAKLLFGCGSAKEEEQNVKGNKSDKVAAGDMVTLGYKSYSILLGEWYFNCHRMLNGEMTIIGQDKYIEVGSNIYFDLRIFDPSENLADFKGREDKFSKNILNLNVKSFGQFLNGPKRYYLLAHVESISHVFNVDSTGARSFFTKISFVRGIIVTEDGQPNSNANSIIGQEDGVKLSEVRDEKSKIIYASNYEIIPANYSYNNGASTLINNQARPYNENIIFDYNNEREDWNVLEDDFNLNSITDYNLELVSNNIIGNEYNKINTIIGKK